MTAPVDIDRLVTWATRQLDNPAEQGVGGLADVARLVLTLADERRDIEQRTAEAIAEALEASPTCPCDVCEFAASSSDRAHTKRAIAAWARAGRWRTP